MFNAIYLTFPNPASVKPQYALAVDIVPFNPLARYVASVGFMVAD